MTAGLAKGQPVLDLDPFATEFLADPYPGHTAMREAGPVVRLERYGIWATARHDPVRTAFLDPQTFCSAAGVGMSDFTRETPWRPPSLLLEADPPEHTAARRVVAGVLSAAAMRRLTETFEAEADTMVAGLVGREVDAMADLAVPYPLRVFSEAVGIPDDGRENLLGYARMVFNTFGPRNELFTTAVAENAGSREWIARQCLPENLVPGGMGAQIHERATAEGFSVDEGAMLVRSFLSAGVDTTVHGLGNALLCFAEHPDQYDVLRADPGLARGAFEEVLRFEAPVQTFFRTTTRDTELDGVPIPDGAKILLFLAAANRDPRRWPDADRFDATRRVNGQLGFGFGIHACVGMAMARLEGEAILSALARRVSRIEIVGEPRRMLNNTLRGLESLPVRLHPS